MGLSELDLSGMDCKWGEEKRQGGGEGWGLCCLLTGGHPPFTLDFHPGTRVLTSSISQVVRLRLSEGGYTVGKLAESSPTLILSSGSGGC